jgi:hypothetical protein
MTHVCICNILHDSSTLGAVVVSILEDLIPS